MARWVNLSEDAYALLTALKKDGESFSNVVERIAAERRNPLALKNLKPPRDDFEIETFREKTRTRDLEKLEDLHRE